MGGTSIMALIKLNNQSISAVSALPSGVAVGNIKKIVTQAYSDFTTTSTSFTEIVTASITKTNSANPVLVQIFSDDYVDTNSTSNWSGMAWGVYKGSTLTFTSGYKGGINFDNLSFGGSCAWVDATNEATSSYSFRVKKSGTTDNVGSTRLHDANGTASNLVILTEYET